ncbi:DUF3375 domain-containing protein [Paraburkholderia caribensis]|uniref:DUF3375 domain-containing protein n=1 Tax=Paraburkholderia caribensis TaxID=75105 RepID=UPI00078C2898|nr:DUF3375 domain-containing protein [Paraburkholderia caribensis]AMV48520.1 hypothetical protein ATN79_48635 [Paraburkholderia caribensis]
MKTALALHELTAMRDKPMWMLLASRQAPLTIALLQSLFPESSTQLGSASLMEKLSTELDGLRIRGEDIEKTPQMLVSEWVQAKWLARGYPEGAHEEMYELSADVVPALQLVRRQLEPQQAATESGLAVVIDSVLRLASETDPDPASRLKALHEESRRITEEIRHVMKHGVSPLDPTRASERGRHIVAMTEAIAVDFRRVREAFERLNRDLRRQLVEYEGSRGEVLEKVFLGSDVIADSDEGRSFLAFWGVLTNPSQFEGLKAALEALESRPFIRSLGLDERRRLFRVTETLLLEGGMVQDVMATLGRSLKIFVQSREFQEQRKIQSVIRAAISESLALKDQLTNGRTLDYTLTLSTSSLRSVAQLVLRDPQERPGETSVDEAEAPEIDLDAMREMIDNADIDIPLLKANIRGALAEHSQVSVGELTKMFDVSQGLASIVGYMSLGQRYGIVLQNNEREFHPWERVSWTGQDGTLREGRIAQVLFTRECLNDLH